MLRPHPHLRQAGHFRHAAPGQEGLLCPRLQRGEGRPTMGQLQAEVTHIKILVCTHDADPTVPELKNFKKLFNFFKDVFILTIYSELNH